METTIPLGLALAASPMTEAPAGAEVYYDPAQQLNVTADGQPYYQRSGQSFPTTVTPPGGTQTDTD